ncbi:M20/M25/M40 family metallo-hydrolase [Kocuria sediminis]|uniref:M20/M25/M40 family metallo-hydrolase n=1 Tax=Kocuria sediminis TaxID=1038857 RepID=A0A6N8GG71_9MICC|nr:M28 family peptidase [Kocuria sediminis]MUN62156.1 M20/M25/M40 family metallo-hydrolase [Kocuria sediminis]
MSHRTHRHRAVAAALAGAVSLTAPSAVAAPPEEGAGPGLEVSTGQVLEHLEVLQAVAHANGGTRASGTPGYRGSLDYVVGRLRAAGYAPRVQAFTFPFFQEVVPTTVGRPGPDGTPVVLPATEVSVMVYSGSGTVTAPVQAVDTTGAPEPSTSGCEAEDFTGFTAGNVALLQRGTCPFGVKAANAQVAGASAVLIFNTGLPGEEGVVAGTLGEPGTVTVPVVGLSHAAGTALLAGGEVTVTAQTVSESRQSFNVVVETGTGDPGNSVMVGAHLDSVPEGAGINDNGSGSAAILAIAEALAGTETTNTVRFAWWGAEEFGLRGSQHYVEDLRANDPGSLENIALYLNFDMIGSPNHGRFVYDGDHSAFPPVQGPEGPVTAPEGSAAIEAAFHEHFGSVGLASGETEFSGRSDYGPFIAEGIPSGGLFTGAEGIKTVEQAALFGGRAGVAYDFCYHAACDDLANVDVRGLEEMTDAAAAVVSRFAASTQDVDGTGTGETGQQGARDLPLGPATVDQGHGPHSAAEDPPAL